MKYPETTCQSVKNTVEKKKQKDISKELLLTRKRKRKKKKKKTPEKKNKRKQKRKKKKNPGKKEYNKKCHTKPYKFEKLIYCDNNNRMIKYSILPMYAVFYGVLCLRFGSGQ